MDEPKAIQNYRVIEEDATSQVRTLLNCAAVDGDSPISGWVISNAKALIIIAGIAHDKIHDYEDWLRGQPK